MYTDCREMKKLVDSAEVVSFDIFDTLIVRHFLFPTDIFSVVENDSGCEGFKKARIEAEQKARKELIAGDKEEVTLNEIYSFLSSDYQELRDAEITAEIKYCLPNEEVVEVFNYAKKMKKQVVITSEMYLPEKVIRRMLEVCGISDFDTLYLSSSCLKVKAGSLFPFLLKDFSGIKRSKFVHFGDSLAADILPAKKQGLKTGYYQSVVSQLTGFGLFDECFFTNVAQADLLDISFLAKICALFVQKNKDKIQQDFVLLGALVVWPLTMLFNNWLVALCQKKKIQDIYFLSRDGFLFQSVFDLVHNKDGDFNSHKMYCSRKSLAIPVESCVDPNFDLLMYGLTGEFTAEALWEHLDIENDDLKKDFYSFLRRKGTKQKFDSHLLRDFLKQERTKILAYYEQEQELILDYLESISLFSQKSAIVDIGWSGTMQRSLKLLATARGIMPDINGFYLGTGEGCQLSGSESEGFTTQKGKPDFVHRLHMAILDIEELLITVPTQSVRGYQRTSSGKIEPVLFQRSASEQMRLSISEQVNLGLLELTSFYLENDFDQVFSYSPEDGQLSAWMFLDCLRRLPQKYLDIIQNISVFASHNTNIAAPMQYTQEKSNG